MSPSAATINPVARSCCPPLSLTSNPPKGENCKTFFFGVSAEIVTTDGDDFSVTSITTFSSVTTDFEKVPFEYDCLGKYLSRGLNPNNLSPIAPPRTAVRATTKTAKMINKRLNLLSSLVISIKSSVKSAQRFFQLFINICRLRIILNLRIRFQTP